MNQAQGEGEIQSGDSLLGLERGARVVSDGIRQRFGAIDIKLTLTLDVLAGQLTTVQEWLLGIDQILSNMPSKQRQAYFDKPEYKRLMEYVALCPNDDSSSRGSIDGTLGYIDRMRTRIRGQLKQLPTQTQKVAYLQNDPGIIAFKDWLDKYSEYNTLEQ